MSTVGGDNNFVQKLPPMNTYYARLVWMIDYGTQDKYFKGQLSGTAHKGQWWFELVDTNEDFGKGHPEPFFVKTKELTYNLAGTSNTLRDYLSILLQRPIVKSEVVDLRQFIGMPCMVQIVHAKSADGSKTYANIASVMTVPPGTNVNPLRNPALFFDIGSPDMFTVFQAITNKYVQGTIVKSPEFQKCAMQANFPWQQYVIQQNNQQAPAPQQQFPVQNQYPQNQTPQVQQQPAGQWTPPVQNWGQQGLAQSQQPQQSAIIPNQQFLQQAPAPQAQSFPPQPPNPFQAQPPVQQTYQQPAPTGQPQANPFTPAPQQQYQQPQQTQPNPFQQQQHAAPQFQQPQGPPPGHVLNPMYPNVVGAPQFIPADGMPF